MNCKLYLLDEINVGFEGLEERHIEIIIRRTSLMKKGAFMTAAYQMKLDDGMESNFHENGATFFYMLEKVLPMVEEFGYEIEVIDYRKTISPKKYIDKDLFKSEGIELYPYQVDSVNFTIDNDRGIIEVATSGGKSFVASAITKVYEDKLDFVTIVPTEKLVKQMHKTYSDFGMDIGHITKGMSAKKREEEWKHRHVVCTWQLLKNNKHRLERFGGFIYDEAHVMGDVMANIFANELAHCMIRIGMTGTLPKDAHKREMILCRIGGDSVIKVMPKELQDAGFISTCDIEMYPFEHEFEVNAITMEMITNWEWDQEDAYLLSNPERIDAIVEFIQGLEKKTTLILCFKGLGNKLKHNLGYDLITGDTKENIREVYYKKLQMNPNYNLVATYDTVGTGTSIDEIERVITIDVGKNDTRITQGIGRGLRKDGKGDHLKVIDIYSKLVYVKRSSGRLNDFSYSGTKHLNLRKKEYNHLEYPYKIMKKIIV